MKQFEVPSFYRSPIIGKVKAQRKLEDPRKKDFSPSELIIGDITFIIPRHFGFCYGVENAIEKSYKAISENPTKRIFLLSQMIHNPDVNDDLQSYGLTFLQDTKGNQLIPFDSLTSDDVVIIPAFGTTLEIEQELRNRGVNIDTYNTTCPFVEKVWNRSEKLGELGHTLIIHGKHEHEETRATFSHSQKNAPSIVVRNMEETKVLSDAILGKVSEDQFWKYFENKTSKKFQFPEDLLKIGVVNQTTMLASETQEITDFLRETMIFKYGEDQIREHIADTRDTLCYATNDNQSATYGLFENEADLAVVVGGYNSSNTSHLVELLERKFKTYYVKGASEINSRDNINSFNIHHEKIEQLNTFLPNKDQLKIIVTSGASCPDALVDKVIQKIVELHHPNESVDNLLATLNL
ncbi:MAG: 4-hydroxy-3-methylbut-2-enyl diphosphate reductase [Crocinitomicaceae bacterium]